MEPIEASLGKILARGTASGVRPDDLDALMSAARLHRIEVLLAHAVLDDGLDRRGEAAWSREELEDIVRLAAARELGTARVVTALFDGAHARGLDLLLLKGTALAYTHYARPYLRPRNDIDLLVREADVERTETMLLSQAYRRASEADAELWTGQRHYLKPTHAGDVHVDLHWRAANPRAFDAVLPFEDALSRSAVVPALGPDVRTLSPPDALLLACVHRVAHHQDRVNLLWLYDVHLIASALSGSEWQQFAGAASKSGVREICARGLSLASEYFSTAIPEGMMRSLEAAGAEPTVEFLREGMRTVDVARADLAALPGWRRKAALVREHLWPPVTYMRAKYSRWPAILLPFAYVHRIVRGAPKWFVRQV